MAQLRLGYEDIRRRGAEVLWVTHTPPSVGPLYARRFSLPFPYLCDENLAVHHHYGLTSRGTRLASLKVVLKGLPGGLTGMAKGEQPSLKPYKGVDITTEHGMFLLARDGRVRFRHITGPQDHIPRNEVLLREMQALG